MPKAIFTVLVILFFACYANAQHKVVLHLSSKDTAVWKGLMNNLKNLKNGWGNSVDIAVVTHGPGVEMMMGEKTTQLNAINSFKAMGIHFYVCENTLREKMIDKSRIIAAAEYVPMAVGELIMRQEQGWSYIKVGF